MAKVGLELGVTMHLGKLEHNEYFRCLVKIDEIDTEKPLDEQLAAVDGSIEGVMAMAAQKLNAEVEKVLGGG